MGKLLRILYYSQTLVPNAAVVLDELKKQDLVGTPFREGCYRQTRCDLYAIYGVREYCEAFQELLQVELGGPTGLLNWDRAHAIRTKAESIVKACKRFQQCFDTIARWAFEDLEVEKLAKQVRQQCLSSVMGPATRMLNLARKLQRAAEYQQQYVNRIDIDGDEGSGDDGGVGEELFEWPVAQPPAAPMSESTLAPQMMPPRRSRKGSCIIL